jgi:hypothetical protein
MMTSDGEFYKRVHDPSRRAQEAIEEAMCPDARSER